MYIKAVTQPQYVIKKTMKDRYLYKYRKIGKHPQYNWNRIKSREKNTYIQKRADHHHSHWSGFIFFITEKEIESYQVSFYGLLKRKIRKILLVFLIWFFLHFSSNLMNERKWFGDMNYIRPIFGNLTFFHYCIVIIITTRKWKIY